MMRIGNYPHREFCRSAGQDSKQYERCFVKKPGIYALASILLTNTKKLTDNRLGR